VIGQDKIFYSEVEDDTGGLEAEERVGDKK